MLGKRPRHGHPMKRTTSMSEITFDLSTSSTTRTESGTQKQADGLDQRFSPTTQNYPRKSASSGGFLDTPFLRSCSLCRRRLVPSRDIYMYRGDSAFCSLECRQHQMNHDERIDKCSLASN